MIDLGIFKLRKNAQPQDVNATLADLQAERDSIAKRANALEAVGYGTPEADAAEDELIRLNFRLRKLAATEAALIEERRKALGRQIVTEHETRLKAFAKTVKELEKLEAPGGEWETALAVYNDLMNRRRKLRASINMQQAEITNAKSGIDSDTQEALKAIEANVSNLNTIFVAPDVDKSFYGLQPVVEG